MQALIYSNKDIKEIFNTIKEFMKKENFIFEEKDRIYLITQNNQGITKNLAKIKFWAINRLLKDFPPNLSLVIEGEIRKDKETVVEIEIKEYHGKREHIFAGSLAIEKYFNLFCKIFNPERIPHL